jgi:uncharacterized tellurite resistance protein B-like protein
MLNSLRDFLVKHVFPDLEQTGSEADPEHAVRLATAALLVEVMRADFAVAPEERSEILAVMQRHFDLTDEETRELLAAAEAETDAAVSLFPMVKLLNDTLDPSQRAHVVELLWRVAYSDGRVDKYEEGLIRKVAELLFVPHGDFIRAKHRAQQGL